MSAHSEFAAFLPGLKPDGLPAAPVVTMIGKRCPKPLAIADRPVLPFCLVRRAALTKSPFLGKARFTICLEFCLPIQSTTNIKYCGLDGTMSLPRSIPSKAWQQRD